MSNWIMSGILCVCIFWQVFEKSLAMEMSDDIQVHGFLSQGYFLTSDNRLFGKSDIDGGSFSFTEAGLNGSWMPNADFRLAAQILFRRAGIGHENDLELDFGLIDYTIFSTVDYRLGIRLGRIKVPFGFYNDTRDMVFTRPTILLPQSIYPDATRDLSISADGGLIYADYRSGSGNFSFELGSIYPKSSTLDTELSFLGQDYPGNTFSGLSYVGRLIYDLESGKYRMAISSMRIDTRYDPALLPPDDLFAGKDIFTPVIFSGQYNQENFSLTAEYSIRPVKDKGFRDDFDDRFIGEAYYLQAEYRFNNNWQAVLRYDVLYNDRSDKSGNRYQSMTRLPAHFQFAKDWTIGFRYNIGSSFLFAAEYHYVNGTAWLPFQDNPDPDDMEQQWQMFSVLASYRF